MEIPDIYFKYRLDLEEIMILAIIRDFQNSNREFNNSSFAKAEKFLRLRKDQLTNMLKNFHKRHLIKVIKIESGFKFELEDFVKNLEPLPPNQPYNKLQTEARKEIPPADRFYVLNRDYFTCCCCGISPATKFGTVLVLDHIIPLAKGGNNSIYNLQTLCETCNSGKSSNLQFNKETTED